MYLSQIFSLLKQCFLRKPFDHVGVLEFFHLGHGAGITALILYLSFILFQSIPASFVFLVLQLFIHYSSVWIHRLSTMDSNYYYFPVLIFFFWWHVGFAKENFVILISLKHLLISEIFVCYSG